MILRSESELRNILSSLFFTFIRNDVIIHINLAKLINFYNLLLELTYRTLRQQINLFKEGKKYESTD